MKANINDDEVAVSNVHNLKSYCKKRDITMYELSRKIGCSGSYLCQCKIGKQSCSVVVYNALADFLGFAKYQPGRKLANTANFACSTSMSKNIQDSPNINDDAVAMANIRTLKSKRISLGLSQQEMADAIGIKYGADIGHYERGSRDCPVDVYNKLCEKFGWDKYVSGRIQTEVQTDSAIRELTLGFDVSEEENSQHKRHDDIKTYVRLPEALRNDLYTIATIQHTTMSDLIIKLITEYTTPQREVIDAVTALRNNSKQKESK